MLLWECKLVHPPRKTIWRLLKNLKIRTGHRELMLVILANQEAEIRRITVLASWGKWFVRTYLKNTQHKTGLVE
jgi:hypothetical protein